MACAASEGSCTLPALEAVATKVNAQASLANAASRVRYVTVRSGQRLSSKLKTTFRIYHDLAVVPVSWIADCVLGSKGRVFIGLPLPSDQVLAEMIGTTRPRVNVFMNRFRKLRFISNNGRIEVHKSLLQALRCGRGRALSHPPILGGSRLCDPRASTLGRSCLCLG